MKRVVAFLAVMMAACQGAPEPMVEEFTDAQRSQIEAQVRQVVEAVYAAARDADAEGVFVHASTEDGLCVMGRTISSCQEVQNRYREAWSPDREERLEQQEMEGQEIRVMALSPTVAVVAATTQENRAYRTTGEMSRAAFASFFVYILEDGEWKSHSGQQASWAIVDETQD